MNVDADLLLAFLTAIGGGLLVGIDRERRKGTGRTRAAIGLRTCVLVAVTGAAAMLLGTGTLLVAGAGVCALTVAAYWRSRETDPGLTTEYALLLTYLLGALAVDHTQLAAALYVLLASVLAGKLFLHRFARQILRPSEIADALRLAAAALIVLPLLPDRVVDPLGVLNPRQLWMFAIFVMAMNAAGYVALRLLGPGRGLSIAGFFGGFISSVATTNGMAQRARSDQRLRADCVAAALLSGISSLAQLAVVLSVVAPELLAHVAVSMIAAGACAVVVGSVALIAARGSIGIDGTTDYGRPLALRQAFVFVGIVGVSLIVAALLQKWIGEGGVFAAAAATGVADVHAAAVGIGQLIVVSGIPLHEASVALAIAYTTNSFVKCVGSAAGGVAFALPVSCGVILVNATLLIATFLT